MRAFAKLSGGGITARTVFTTSRQLEFCTVRELTKLVGCEPAEWPGVLVKELIDNSLDASEEAGIAPEISIAISTRKGTITVADNGPGIAPDTVTHLLDYHTKTSSREAYVAPRRAMPCKRCSPCRSRLTAAVARA